MQPCVSLSRQNKHTPRLTDIRYHTIQAFHLKLNKWIQSLFRLVRKPLKTPQQRKQDKVNIVSRYPMCPQYNAISYYQSSWVLNLGCTGWSPWRTAADRFAMFSASFVSQSEARYRPYCNVSLPLPSRTQDYYSKRFMPLDNKDSR